MSPFAAIVAAAAAATAVVVSTEGYSFGGCISTETCERGKHNLRSLKSLSAVVH